MPIVYIGYDSKEALACEVATSSLIRHASVDLTIRQLRCSDLRISGFYTRPEVYRNGHLWDLISEAPMSTTHAIARFFIPFLADARGWVLFTDGDVLFRRDVSDLFALADPSKAVMVVHHKYRPIATAKKDGAIQTQYSRKNWSSVMLWNCDHEKNYGLTRLMLNTTPGRDLHRFCWLEDKDIGALPEEWNWLVNHSPLDMDPALVHFTEGLPDVSGHEDDPYSEEWLGYAKALGLHAGLTM